MVWSIESDDTQGICGEKYPLLTVLNRILYISGNNIKSYFPESNQLSASKMITSTPSSPTYTKNFRKAHVTTTTQKITTADDNWTHKKDLDKCFKEYDPRFNKRSAYDCSKFYTCENEGGVLKRIYRNCPDNLFFNEITNQCDFPENIDCIQNII